MSKQNKDFILDIDVSIDTNKRIITVISKMKDEELYTFLKSLWMKSPHYIKFLFPMTSFIDLFGNEHISMVNDWQLIGIQNIER